ncbi:hypothetical protein [Micromonospora sp. RP3T]|uniref:hypothetical protein n=1 Tax=Micromonospora sp. RP3T TaxID=2135446 RepID=UPI001E3CDBF2|nr:hypothetical protein [Micromonospora sp. RP3T]
METPKLSSAALRTGALLVEYRGDRVGLLFHLGGLMAEAHEHLARLNPDHVPDLHRRFLAWARARG